MSLWQSGGSFGGGSQSAAEPGGFMDVSSQFDSPSEKKKDTNQRKSQNLVCATVQQVLGGQSDSLKIGRIEANLLRMVARVKSVEMSSTRIKYELEDDTGTITAISWLDGDSDTQNGPLVENTYCAVVGSVRSQEGSRYLMLLQAEPLQDANQLTAHLLGVVHNELLANKPPFVHQPAPGAAAGMAGPSGMMMPAQVKMETGGDLKDRILQFIVGFHQSEAGVGKKEIQTNFVRGNSARQIDEAVDFLCNEGQIYTTIDDEHYKSTE